MADTNHGAGSAPEAAAHGGEEFRPILTQEELNSRIGTRIAREREAVQRQFEAQIGGFRSDLAARDQRIKELEAAAKQHEGDAQTIRDLQARVKGFETDALRSKIAHEAGLPYGMASRLTGEKEEDIRKDAEEVRALMRGALPREPLAKPQGSADGVWGRLASQLIQQ